MKNKEIELQDRVLLEHGIEFDRVGYCGTLEENNARSFMQEYADEQAVSFLEWIGMKNYYYSMCEECWLVNNNNNGYTTTELLQIFKQENK